MAENLEATNEQGQSNTETETEKTSYTREEVEELLQKETDRRVTSALKKQELKNAQAMKEAQKLSAMNETQKYEYELSQREQAIAEKEKQLALAEMTNTASKILAEKGLSLDLVRFVVDADGDVTNANIKALEKAFKKSVTDEVTKRIGAGADVRRPQTDPDTITKEQFKKMSLNERQELFNNSPDIYNALKGS